MPTILRPQLSSDVRGARSVYGGSAATIQFFHRLHVDSAGMSPAHVYAIDYEGQRSLVRTIAPGSEHMASTFVGQLWEVVISRQGETVRLIYSARDESQVFIDAALFPIKYLVPLAASQVQNLRSEPGSPSTIINFENHLRVKVKIYWVDMVGKPQFYASIPPGGSSRQNTYVGHPWEVIAEDEKLPFVVFYGAAYDGTAKIESSLLGGQRSD
ncbi:hypothetical protein DXG01_010930 [Tephrocybe rancida]|nr:hypothetical protein DXG01_010930 [Tephrocybe rancida]